MVAQILVSQAYTVAYIGDPALTYFPTVDQYRDRYVVLTPPTWTQNYFVLTTRRELGGDRRAMGNFTRDGGGLPASWLEHVVGTLDAIENRAVTVPTDRGAD